MTKTAFGLASGVALVVVTLIAVALANLPAAEGATSAEPNAAANCPLTQVAQDQGYGITRTVARRVCGSAVAR